MSGAIEETCEYVIFGDGLAELALGTFLNIHGHRAAVIKSAKLKINETTYDTPRRQFCDMADSISTKVPSKQSMAEGETKQKTVHTFFDPLQHPIWS